MNPLSKVNSGQRVRFSAAMHNAMTDAAIAAKNRGNFLSQSADKQMRQILVSPSEDIGVFQPVKLTGSKITPDDYGQFQKTPVLGCVPAQDGDEFAVTVKPIKSGEIGPAIIFGQAQVKVRILSDSHKCVTPKKTVDGDTATYFDSAETGHGTILWKPQAEGPQWCIICVLPQPDSTPRPFDIKSIEGEENEKTITLENCTLQTGEDLSGSGEQSCPLQDGTLWAVIDGGQITISFDKPDAGGGDGDQPFPIALYEFSNGKVACDYRFIHEALPSDETPLESDGDGEPGTSERYARADHVHPKDKDDEDDEDGGDKDDPCHHPGGGAGVTPTAGGGAAGDAGWPPGGSGGGVPPTGTAAAGVAPCKSNYNFN